MQLCQNRKTYYQVLGIALTIIFVCLGFFWKSGMYYVSAYLFLALQVFSIKLVKNNWQTPEKLWWLPVTTFGLYILNFGFFELRCSIPLVDNFYLLILSFGPLTSFILLEKLVHSLPSKIIVIVIFVLFSMPTVATTFQGFSSFHTTLQTYKRNGKIFKLIFIRAFDSESLALYKTVPIFPGYEKRTLINITVAEYGKIKTRKQTKNSILIDYTSNGVDYQNTLKIPTD